MLMWLKKATDFAADDEKGEEEGGEERYLASGGVVMGWVFPNIAADPSHGDGEEAEEDHGADAAGKTEGAEKNMGIVEGEKEGGREGEGGEPGEIFAGGLFLEAVGEEVGQSESLGEKRGDNGKESKALGEAADGRGAEGGCKGNGGFFSIGITLFNGGRLDNAEDEERPDEINKEGEEAAAEDREAHLFKLAVEIGGEAWDHILKAERDDEDGEREEGHFGG